MINVQETKKFGWYSDFAKINKETKETEPFLILTCHCLYAKTQLEKYQNKQQKNFKHSTVLILSKTSGNIFRKIDETKTICFQNRCHLSKQTHIRFECLHLNCAGTVRTMYVHYAAYDK